MAAFFDSPSPLHRLSLFCRKNGGSLLKSAPRLCQDEVTDARIQQHPMPVGSQRNCPARIT
jgi:hypothetical protein